MEKGNSLTFGAGAWRLVDETHTVRAAALEGRIEIVNRETDMMDAWTAFRDELGYGRVGRLRLEQLDERRSGREARDPGAVGAVERHVSEPEHVPVERRALVEPVNGDANVCDAGAELRSVVHDQLI